MSDSTVNGLRLVLTCGACPEQYDVFLGPLKVGYLRLRHGCFYAAYPDAGGDVVYEAEPEGDGSFLDNERDEYLLAATQALRDRVKQDLDQSATTGKP